MSRVGARREREGVVPRARGRSLPALLYAGATASAKSWFGVRAYLVCRAGFAGRDTPLAQAIERYNSLVGLLDSGGPARPPSGSHPERSAAPRAGGGRVPVDLGPHFRNQIVHLLAGLGGELPQLIDRRQAAPDEPLRDGANCRTCRRKDDRRRHGRTEADQEAATPSLGRRIQQIHAPILLVASFTKNSHWARC